jgi:hypothetical protein
VRQRTGFLQHNFVSIEQPPQLVRRALATAWRAGDSSFFDDVVRQRECHAAERLNALRECVHQLELLAVMLVGIAHAKLLHGEATGAL